MLAPKKSISNRAINITCILFGLFILVYIVLRAIYVPPYSDEVSTFFFYIQRGSFQPFYAHLDANNHIVNSLFGYLSYKVFGSHIFFLRLPNVIAFVFFLFFLWKIKDKFKSNYIGLLWFITLISAQYFIDFFSLCRGYGMSMAFLMGSVYHCINYQLMKNNKNLFLTLLFASLAVWANLSLIVPILLMGLILFSLMIRNYLIKPSLIQIGIQLLIFVIVFVLPFAYAVFYTVVLKNAGLLYHAKNGSFVNITVGNLIWEFSNPFTISKFIFFTFFIGYVLLLCATFIYKLYNYKFVVVHCLFWGSIIGTILLHHLIGIGYTMDRAAIYLFPLFILSLMAVIDCHKAKLVHAVALVPVSFFILQLCFVFNLRYTQHWKAEAIPETYYNYIAAYSAKQSILPTISSSYLQKNVFSWYDFQNNGLLNGAQEINYPDTLADFIITDKWWINHPIKSYDTVFFDFATDVALLKRRRIAEWEKIDDISSSQTKLGINNIPLAKILAWNYLSAPFLFDIQFKAESKIKPAEWFLVCDVVDSAGNNLVTEFVDLERVKPDIQQPSIIHRRMLMGIIPLNSRLINFYIWNVKRTSIKISDLRLRTYKLNAHPILF